MRIVELKELGCTKLYERALKCMKEQDRTPNKEAELSKSYSFFWTETKEGWDFWSYVNDKKFEEAFKLFPEYREETIVKKGEEITFKVVNEKDSFNEWQPKEGDMILVYNDDNSKWEEKEFIYKVKGLYLVWESKELLNVLSFVEVKPIE
jgi:hypothetical protein